MKEEIELSKQLLDEMEDAHEAGDIEAVSGKANIIKTLMDSIELSGVAYGLANDPEIEPWDPDEDEFCELEDEEFEDNEEETPKEAEE